MKNQVLLKLLCFGLFLLTSMQIPESYGQAFNDLKLDQYDVDNQQFHFSWKNVSPDIVEFTYVVDEGLSSEVSYGPFQNNAAIGVRSDVLPYITFPKSIKLNAHISGGTIYSDAIVFLPFKNLKITAYDETNDWLYFSWENLVTGISSYTFTVLDGNSGENTFGPTSSFNTIGMHSDYVGGGIMGPHIFTLKAIMTNGDVFEQTVTTQSELSNFEVTSYNYLTNDIYFSWENGSPVTNMAYYVTDGSGVEQQYGPTQSFNGSGVKSDYIYDKDTGPYTFRFVTSYANGAEVEDIFNVAAFPAFKDFSITSIDFDTKRIYIHWENLSTIITQMSIIKDKGLASEAISGPSASIGTVGIHDDYINFTDLPETVTLQGEISNGTLYEKVIILPKVPFQNFAIDSYDLETKRVYFSWENIAEGIGNVEIYTRIGTADWEFLTVTGSFTSLGAQSDYINLPIEAFASDFAIRITNPGNEATVNYSVEATTKVGDIAFRNFELTKFDSDIKQFFYSWENISGNISQYDYIVDEGLSTEAIFGPYPSAATIGVHSNNLPYTTFPKTFKLRAHISNGTFYSKAINPMPQQEFQNFVISGYDTENKTISMAWENLTANTESYEFYTRETGGDWVFKESTSGNNAIGNQTASFSFGVSDFGKTFDVKLVANVAAENGDYYEIKPVTIPAIAFQDFKIDSYDSDIKQFFYSWENISSDIAQFTYIVDKGLSTEAIYGPYPSSASIGVHSNNLPYTTFPKSFELKAQMSNGTVYSETMNPMPQQEFANFTVDSYNTTNKTISISWNNLTSNAAWYKVFYKIGTGSWTEYRQNYDVTAIGAQSWTFAHDVSWFGKTVELRLFAGVAAVNADYYEEKSVTMPEVAFDGLSANNFNSDLKEIHFSWNNLSSNISTYTFVVDKGLPSEKTYGPTAGYNAAGLQSGYVNYTTFPKTFTLQGNLNNGLSYTKTIDLPENALENLKVNSHVENQIVFDWTNLTPNIYKIELNTNVDNAGWAFAWETTNSSVTGAGNRENYVNSSHDSRLADIIGKEVKIRIIAYLSNGKQYREEITFNDIKPFENFRLSYNPDNGLYYTDWKNTVAITDLWFDYTDAAGAPLYDDFHTVGAKQTNWHYELKHFDADFSVTLNARYNGVDYSETKILHVASLKNVAMYYDENADKLKATWFTDAGVGYLDGVGKNPSFSHISADYLYNGGSAWTTASVPDLSRGTKSFTYDIDPMPGFTYHMQLNPYLLNGGLNKSYKTHNYRVPVKDDFAISSLTANFQGDETDSPVTIKLNWKAPTDLAKWGSLADFEGYYKIYRKERADGGQYGAWTLLSGSFGFGDNFTTLPQYTDSDNLDYCKQYTYSIEMFGVYNGGGEFFIFNKQVANVKSNGAEDPPSNLQVSKNRCDSSIEVNWEWYQKNPSEFRVEQLQVVGNDTISVSTKYILGEDRSFVFDNVVKNQWYLFRMTTKGFCGYSSSLPSKIVNGFSPDQPAAPSDFTATFTENPFETTLKWIDNSINEEKFIVERIETGGTREEFIVESSISESTATGRVVTFLDDNLNNCAEYTYKVYAWNGCSTEQHGTIGLNDAVIRPFLGLTDIFNGESLLGSKGYYSGSVDLKFQPSSGYRKAENFKIYSRVLGTSVVPQLLATIDVEKRDYSDLRAEAGVLYEYFIIAETYCGDEFIYSFDINGMHGSDYQIGFNLPQGVGYSIGFRSPTGVANGNITYSGGIPVRNVKVVAERENGNTGNSLDFNGASYVHIPYNTSLQGGNAITLSAWVLPNLSVNSEMVIIRKVDTYSLVLYNGRVYFSVKDQNGDWKHLLTDIVQAGKDDLLVQDRYASISGTLDGNTMRMYIDGKEVNNTSWTSGLAIQNDESDLYIGGLSSNERNFQGTIDEVRLYNRALSEIEILQSYGRIIPVGGTGLRGYWKMNEGIGPYIFDASKEGTLFHKNHGRLYSAAWSETIPTASQLSFASFTNENGNYSIAGIEYRGTGENFKIIPTISLSGAVHEFDPGEKILFIGEGNTVQNGVDFKDISSFKVTGQVLYKFGNNNSGSEDARVYIDGIPVSDGFGNTIKTNEFGQFTIQVPIGFHKISVQRGFHTFENEGVWPSTNEPFDFQAPVSGLEFWDITLRKVAGRAVGGTREGDKVLGFGKSVNNIGQTTFKLISQDGLIADTVTTDIATGEYETALPPKLYNIFKISDGQPGLQVASNLALDFGVQESVDLTNAIAEFTERDTVDATTVLEYTYNIRRDFIYRSLPKMNVTDGNESYANNALLGKRQIIFTGDDDNEYTIDAINNSTQAYSLGRPIYNMYEKESLRISVFETYTNYDVITNLVEDLVPVSDATLSITNNAGLGFYYNDQGAFTNYPAGATEILNLSDADGDTLYHFTPDEPNLTINSSDPTLSYTRSLAISATAGGNTVTWPNASNPSEVLNVYVLGSRGTTTSFITKAPDMVDFILRDPPGSNSYSFIEKGQTLTKSTTFSSATESSLSLKLGFGVGLNTLLGGGIVGVGETFKFAALGTVGLNISGSVGVNGEKIETLEFTQRFQTNTQPVSVGAQGDLFIGKSENYRYGISDNLVFLPATQCGLDEVLCADGFPSVFSSDGTEFRLARRYGFYLVPDGIPTYFIYSQSHIENYLIPDLRTLRNTILNTNAAYVSNVTGTDTRFGTNNDNEVWGAAATTETPLTTEPADFTGDSYTFTPSTNTDIDSIRWYNQQIRLWKGELAKNEKEKLESIAAGVNKDNFSFSSGSTISSEKTFTQTGSQTTTFELAVGMSTGVDVTMSGYGVALSVDMEAAVTQKIGFSSSSTETNTVTYGYELNDNDVGDFFSVDIYDGKNNNGPIFSTVGGQTMCPHEDAVLTKYYQVGSQLSARTLQRDKPNISVAVAEVFNVPADEAAVFTLTLSNESESFDDMLYILEVFDETNPNGAVLKIDGAPFTNNREIFIAGSSAVNKTLTIERGPYEYDYSNIKIAISSKCQFSIDDDVDIFETVSLSAHFIPTCTKADIISPSNQWIVNNAFENVLPITFGGYNINYEGFEKVELHYKPRNVSSWIVLEKFYRNQDAADAAGVTDATLLASVGNSTTFNWELGQLPDGQYDLKVVSVCALASESSEIYSGLIDRSNPMLFGSTQPADGILSYGDDIVVQFTEAINESLLVPSNFSIKGVLNGTDIRHDASIFFDGSSSHYMKIPNGFDFRQKSFSVEMYAKRNRSGVAEILFSQGTTAATAFTIGFTADDKPYFNMAGKMLVAQTPITDNNWHHLTFMVDVEKTDAQIFIDAISDNVDNEFFSNYQETGAIYIGKQDFDSPNAFQGNIHELRFWDKALSPGLVSQVAVKTLSRTKRGLIANWRLDEIHGTVAQDHVSFRHAEVFGTWKMEPGGKAIVFTGTDGIFKTTSPAFTSDLDFTIELWFKTDNAQEMGIWSNGKGDGTDANLTGWALGIAADGKVTLSNNSKFASSTNSFNNGLWHHIALISNRLGNTTIYIDGQQEIVIESGLLTGFGGSKWWIGSRGWYDAAIEKSDRYFKGSIDEIRVWNYAKTLAQIELNQYHQLIGDEPGLQLYYPFENYTDLAGVMVINSTTENQSTSSALIPSSENLVGAVAITDEAATIKLARPVQKVNFSYASNNDKIILTLLDPDSLLENVILEIAVKDVQDLNGNKQPAPIVWNAYVDKNQVVWVEDSKNINLEFGNGYSFETNISNGSGQIYSFEISNIPSWLTISPSSGTINPLTSRTISMTVSEDANIGEFEHNLYLSTEFGFEEKFAIDLNVFKPAPSAWEVNEADFEYSMNLIAQVEIGGVVSRDKNVVVAAFVDNEIRGIAQLKYIAPYDNYQVFMSVYSNVQTGETVKYKVWNAAEGKIHSNITPNADFIADQTLGLPSTPILLVAPNYLEQTMNLVTGWQWLSFNIASNNFANINQFMGSFPSTNGDLMKGQYSFDQYDAGSWFGSLTSDGGLKNSEMYKMKISAGAALTFEGDVIDPTSVDINIATGWNWVGFVSQRNININEALVDFTATENDEIKSQSDFAIYTGTNYGWIGSLESLKPGMGYMLKSAQAGSFKYPAIGILPRSAFKVSKNGSLVEKATEVLSNMGEQFDASTDFAKNMNVVARSSNELEYDFLVLKVNGNIRDIALPVHNPITNKKVYFFTLGGNNAEAKLTFFAAINGEMMELKPSEIVNFAANTTVGTLEQALVLHDDAIANIIGTESSLKFDVSTYPNPVSNYLHLTMENPKGESVTIALYNAMGQEFFQQTFATSKQRVVELKLDREAGFDFNSLARGYYILRVISGNQMKTIKIIR